MTRKAALARIWRDTHRDYKGVANGVKTIMVLRGGSVLVALDELTDAEIAQRVKGYSG